MKIKLLGLIVTLIMSSIVTAQEDENWRLTPPEFDETGVFFWSSDDRYLAFLTGGQWGLMDLETLEVTFHDSFPLNPDLTAEEMANFNPSEIISVSPNGEMLLFTIPLDGRTRSPQMPYETEQYAIANRLTGQLVVTGIPTIPMIEATMAAMNIAWSADSTALSITTPDEADGVYGYYIGLDDLSDVFTSGYGEYIDGYFYYLQRIYRHWLGSVDMSGDRVLVSAVKQDDTVDIYDQETYILEWMVGFSSQIVAGGEENPIGLRGGFRFSPYSEDELTYLRAAPQMASNGYYVYNMESKLETLVWEFDIEGYIHISPSGSWGIYYQRSGGSTVGTYLVDFAELLARMPQADAGIDQTITDGTVTLNGSGSIAPNGDIISYVWMEGDTELGTGMELIVTLEPGIHQIILIVTDDQGRMDSDVVEVSVE
mgnify:CR=1 FL=1